MFEKTKTEKLRWEREVKKLTDSMQKLEVELAEIRTNKIYENAFEWRFEFPEVLNDDGDFVGFDVVIGNPPYIVVEKSIYKDFTTQNCIDLYCYFMELSLNIIKNNYLVTLITPSLFIKGVKFNDLRKLLLQFNILRIDVQGDGVFEDVQMPTAITFLKKDKQVTPQTWEEVYCSNPIIYKINANSQRLKEVSNIQRGIEIGKDKTLKEGLIPILTGEDLAKYTFKIKKYITSKIYEDYKKDEKYFTGARLIIRETGSKLTVALLNGFLIINRSLYAIKIIDRKISPKFILGILNSKLMQYYYETSFKAETNIFPKIRIIQVKELPIKLGNENKSVEITKLVDDILKSKKSDSAADTSPLEAEIDRLVYELYGLTEEEIRIVEEAVG